MNLKSTMHATVILVTSLSASLVLSAGTQAGTWQWKHDEGKSLALVGANGVVWQLNFDKELTKVRFDPLGTPEGKSLTWDQPPDHKWHHGLWFSWHTINGINYWEHDRTTGKPAGTTELRKVEVTRANQQGAVVILRFAYHPANVDRVIMDEVVTLRIETPRADGSYRIDWEQNTTARVNVTLNRTPPPGQPNGKGHGGYGGLSYRGAKALANVKIIDSKGREDMKTHRQTARWMDVSGTLDGKPAGVTIFDHPSNPRHATPWFIVKVKKKHGPFTYINPALLCWKPLVLPKGRTLRLNYRVLLHRGRGDQATLDAEYQRFAATRQLEALKQK